MLLQPQSRDGRSSGVHTLANQDEMVIPKFTQRPPQNMMQRVGLGCLLFAGRHTGMNTHAHSCQNIDIQSFKVVHLVSLDTQKSHCRLYWLLLGVQTVVW